MTCRNCQAELTRVFVDLGTSPLSNAYVRTDQLDEPEPHYPLRPYICEECLLVQLPVFQTPEQIFGDYAFFSGQSQTWVKHCDEFATKAVQRFQPERVLEIASNDGTMLRAFHRWDVTVCGVEPARNVARQALLEGLPTIDRFFTSELADELVAGGYQADMIVANNVLAHVPDLDDFLNGIKTVLAPDGVVSIEVPSLVNLIEHNQFDTIYHEHFSYFTLNTLSDALQRRGLHAFQSEALPVHGGSWRVYAGHPGKFQVGVGETGCTLDYHHAYADKPAQLKQRMLELLTALRHEGKRIAGYGAPAKATTFLSYCQPAGTMVRVPREPSKKGMRGGRPKMEWQEVAIEDLAVGDRVVTWRPLKTSVRGEQDRGLTLRGKPIDDIKTRTHNGDLVVVEAGEYRSRYAPNHECIVVLGQSLDEGEYVVYLMRRNDQYRVGQCLWRLGKTGNGPLRRLDQQEADEIWVLSVHATKAEALVAEALVAARFGLPDALFINHGSRSTGLPLDRFWREIGENSHRARECLDAHALLMDAPFLRNADRTWGRHHVRVTTAAANLRSGMQVLLPDSHCDERTRAAYSNWTPCSVSREHYEGIIYSLVVADDHTYVGDGIVTHNCGIGPETIEFIVDSTPSKQGKYLPGARIPIFAPEHLSVEQPDVILINAWNWREEIAAKIERDCDWNPLVICRDEVLSGGSVALAA